MPPDLAEEAAQLALLDDDHLWRVARMTVPVEKSKRMQIGDLILLTPHQPRVSRLSEQFTAEMDRAGVSLADLLASLVEERETIY